MSLLNRNCTQKMKVSPWLACFMCMTLFSISVVCRSLGQSANREMWQKYPLTLCVSNKKSFPADFIFNANDVSGTSAVGSVCSVPGRVLSRGHSLEHSGEGTKMQRLARKSHVQTSGFSGLASFYNDTGHSFSECLSSLSIAL